MASTIYLSNALSADLLASTAVTPALSDEYWSGPRDAIAVAHGGAETPLCWIDRDLGITDGDTWVVTATITVGRSAVSLQAQLVGTLVGSDIRVQIATGASSTGWQTGPAQLRFAAADAAIYRVTAVWTPGLSEGIVFAVCELPAAILPQIEHVVLLMNENRSLDSLLGWIYPPGTQTPPKRFLPAGSTPVYDGLIDRTYANSDPAVAGGEAVYASDGTTQWNGERGPILPWFVPSPDPGEEFAHVRTQIFGSGDVADMSGFLNDYLTQCAAGSAAQIMQSFSTAQLPVISTLATSFSVSDAWFASVPSQTWPNRGFVQTGSSDGKVNNDGYLPWDITTVFDVFSSQNLSWKVYNDGLMPSLTKVMFLRKYFDNLRNFGKLGAFQTACAQAADAPADLKLPALSFVEPNFGVVGHDQSYHPPHDVRPGEQYLADIYQAVQRSPYRDKILFLMLFDEHGGTYDHVPPPDGAQPPQPHPVSTDGSDFHFERFGVRVPAIVMSSWGQPGTVFRSDTGTPLDHTSVLATLRDWQGLADAFERMLPSPRIAAAPNLAYLLTETTPQAWPVVAGPSLELLAIPQPSDEEPLNGVQQGILIGAAGLARGRPLTPEETALELTRLRTHGDGRALAATFVEQLPLR